MGLFGGQLANVVEWEEFRDDVIFWKWSNREIKKSSRLIIKPGQDAIVLYNGRMEGIFTKEGNYEIESQIIPFLSTLKGFKFGFNSGLRAEVLFVNTKEFTIKWGTKNPINIPAPGLPGGMPIRSFGTFVMKVTDYVSLIDKIAGVKQIFTIENVQERVIASLDQLLMKWISKEGKDMFNLQANAYDIATGMKTDLDMDLQKIGFSILDMKISSFTYPKDIQDKITKTASQSMVGDVDRYQRISMIDAMENSNGAGNNAMTSAAGMAMGFNMANNMTNNTFANQNNQKQETKILCPSCRYQIDQDAKFCPSCGLKIGVPPKAEGNTKFCGSCGAAIPIEAKFCTECGQKS